jgi:hypothetical protein
MAKEAVSKIESSDGSISKDASKDDIMSYLNLLSFNKEIEEKEAATATTTTTTTVEVVKTEEEKKVEKAAK